MASLANTVTSIGVVAQYISSLQHAYQLVFRVAQRSFVFNHWPPMPRALAGQPRPPLLALQRPRG